MDTASRVHRLHIVRPVTVVATNAADHVNRVVTGYLDAPFSIPLSVIACNIVLLWREKCLASADQPSVPRMRRASPPSDKTTIIILYNHTQSALNERPYLSLVTRKSKRKSVILLSWSKISMLPSEIIFKLDTSITLFQWCVLELFLVNISGKSALLLCLSWEISSMRSPLHFLWRLVWHLRGSQWQILDFGKVSFPSMLPWAWERERETGEGWKATERMRNGVFPRRLISKPHK